MVDFPAWYITLLIYFVGSTAFSLFQRQISQRSKIPLNLIAALLFALVVYPAGLLYALVDGVFAIQWSWISVSLILSVGIVIGVFNSLTLKLNKHIDATQYIIIGNLYTPLAVVLGVYLLHEAFTAKQFFGMVLLVIGAILVAAKGFKKSTFRFDKYSWYCALASLLLGVGLIIERTALNYMNASAYLVLGWGAQGLVTLILASKEFHLVKQMSRNDWLDVFKIGIARSAHALGFLLSVAISKNIALVATVTSFRIPLVFVASFLLLNERDHLWRKVVGVGIATIGLLLT
jgi:drug/metabolite transporter (DMT)-like permease